HHGPLTHLLINAVHIHACRTRSHGTSLGWRMARGLGVPSANVAGDCIAMLDRDVIGFRPDGTPTVPLAPIALLSDPQGARAGSWEHEVEAGSGPDQFRWDRTRRTVRPGT